ncbi:hypothetical protein AURDEDRAFT_121540 [Auricularia subglabra TFB-10046 SS5]|nr:hypothetical protein AURDEDRAFT_121540 [Auricularia subglabra TFB-10046 SS5]
MTPLLCVFLFTLAVTLAHPTVVVKPKVMLGGVAPLAVPVVKPEIMLGGVAPEGDGHLNISVSGKIFPPSSVAGQEFPQNIKVDCTSCYTRGEMSVSAGGENLGIAFTPSKNFTSPYVQAAHFNFDHNWVGFTIESFEVHIELLIQLIPSPKDNTLVIHLLGKPRDIPIPAIPGLAIVFDPQIHGLVNVSKAVNFTYGFDIAVPPGSTLLIPVFHVEEYIAVGFNETTITPTPFQSSSGDLEMDFQLSFRPVFTLGLTKIFGLDLPDLGGVFDVFTDLPKLDVSISQVHNMTADCAPTSAGERAFPQLTKFEPRIGVDFGLDFLGNEYIPVDFTAPLDSEAPAQCYEYDPKTRLLVTPGSLDKERDSGTSGQNGAPSRRCPAPLLLISALALVLLA